jgi:stage II sporulation protein E
VAAESRISDVRSVVSEQFDGISSMLYDMADEFDREEAFDDRTAGKIVQALKNIEIQAVECGCRIDKYGRMTVEVIARKISGTRYNRMKLLRQIEVCCDRDFDPPIITETAGKVYITLTERAALRIETGIFQIASSPSGISGDAYSTFSDGKGRSFMILSDGMGSGGRAAVDGAMASGLMTRLIKAGFGYDCSLSILNSAMLFKSTDESLATVDVACIDLFSGRCEMLKAGAAPTIVRRSGKCGVAKSTSLPAGILRDVGFDKATVKLRAGDIIVLMSDGATGEGTDWICAELESFGDNTASWLAEHLAQAAKRRRTDGHSDDITVMVGLVEKAV